MQAVIRKRLHQRPRPVARGRVRNHTGLFIHYNDIVIFIQDTERNVFGDKNIGERIFPYQCDTVARLHRA